jgi:hypothetical protein
MSMAYDPETWAEVERLKAEGLSDPEISRRTSIPRSTIYMHFRREATPERTESSDDLRGGSIVAPIPAVLLVVVELLSAVRQGARWAPASNTRSTARARPVYRSVLSGRPFPLPLARKEVAMGDQPVIVTCGMCGQPFEVVPSGPRPFPIGVPKHGMLGPRGEPPIGSSDCRGSGLPPMMFDSRERWESRWRRLFEEAPFPIVLDGAGVLFAT